MDGADGPARGHFVTFGNLIRNREIQVAKGGVECGDKVGQAPTPWGFTGSGVMIDVGLAHDFICGGQVALVEKFFKKAAEDEFVLDGHSICSSLAKN